LFGGGSLPVEIGQPLMWHFHFSYSFHRFARTAAIGPGGDQQSLQESDGTVCASGAGKRRRNRCSPARIAPCLLDGGAQPRRLVPPHVHSREDEVSLEPD
jgi:hypothetical protein